MMTSQCRTLTQTGVRVQRPSSDQVDAVALRAARGLAGIATWRFWGSRADSGSDPARAVSLHVLRDARRIAIDGAKEHLIEHDVVQDLH
jgi:hypothetical protein